MFENPRRGRQARNFLTNVPKMLDLKSSSEHTFSENWRWVPLNFRIQCSALYINLTISFYSAMLKRYWTRISAIGSYVTVKIITGQFFKKLHRYENLTSLYGQRKMSAKMCLLSKADVTANRPTAGVVSSIQSPCSPLHIPSKPFTLS